MKFSDEVQEIFKQAGWFEGRNVKEKFDKVPRFSEFPEFLKNFLYEYGDLVVTTKMHDPDDAKGTLNFGAVNGGYFLVENYLNNKRSYGENIFAFPIAYYDLDNAALECDADGRVYQTGDFEMRLSEDFKTGIELKILEEPSPDIRFWDMWKKEWSKDFV